MLLKQKPCLDKNTLSYSIHYLCMYTPYTHDLGMFGQPGELIKEDTETRGAQTHNKVILEHRKGSQWQRKKRKQVLWALNPKFNLACNC